MKKLIVLLSVVLAVQSAQACIVDIYTHSSMTMVVRDAELSEPIPFANVILYLNGQIITGTTTDFEGFAQLDSIPIGVYDVEIQSLGYIPQRIDSVFMGLAPSLEIPQSLTQLRSQVCVMTVCEFIIDEEMPEELDLASDSLLAEEVGVEEALSAEMPAQVVFYPNPATDVVHVRSSAPLSDLVVYDLLGNIVKSAPAGSTNVNLSDLPSGAYIFQWMMDGAADTHSVVKL